MSGDGASAPSGPTAPEVTLNTSGLQPGRWYRLCMDVDGASNATGFIPAHEELIYE